MPLSLLLTQQLTILTSGLRKLAPWERLTDTFALVARRLRSAFLVRWFGPGLPVDGLDLRVTIGNLDELQARWASAVHGRRADSGSGGPNLTEPLLGTGGMLAGVLAVPMNAMVASVILGSVLDRWWQKLLFGLTWVTGGGLLTGLLLIGVPLLPLAMLAYAISGQFSDTYDLLGAVAMLALAADRLWRQLSGQEPVRNPLLRQLITLADRLAALLAQVLGAVAVAVTRIAPQLGPAVRAARFTLAAVLQIVDAIQLVALNALAGLRLLWAGPNSLPAIARGVVDTLGGLLPRLSALVRATLHQLVTIATARLLPTVQVVVDYVIATARLVQRVIVDHPTVRWLLSLLEIVRMMRAWNAAHPAPPPAAPGASGPTASSPPSKWLTSFPMPASVGWLARVLTTRPKAPSLRVSSPPLYGPGFIGPVATAMRNGLIATPPNPFALEPGERAALERFRNPPSVLGGLRGELQQRRAAAEASGRLFALADVLAGVTPLLARSTSALAPQALSYVTRLAGLLDRIDLELNGKPGKHPTKDLPEPSDVRPVVGRLLVRSEAGPAAEPRLREFVTALRRELDARSYPVAAATAIAAPGGSRR